MFLLLYAPSAHDPLFSPCLRGLTQKAGRKLVSHLKRQKKGHWVAKAV